jgi:biotin operon repressor
MELEMPRFRSTKDGAATLVGKLLLLIINEQETSATLAAKLKVSARQINRYILQLREAGWQIDRVGEWLKNDYYFELKTPKISTPKPKRIKSKRGDKL